MCHYHSHSLAIERFFLFKISERAHRHFFRLLICKFLSRITKLLFYHHHHRHLTRGEESEEHFINIKYRLASNQTLNHTCQSYAMRHTHTHTHSLMSLTISMLHLGELRIIIRGCYHAQVFSDGRKAFCGV